MHLLYKMPNNFLLQLLLLCAIFVIIQAIYTYSNRFNTTVNKQKSILETGKKFVTTCIKDPSAIVSLLKPNVVMEKPVVEMDDDQIITLGTIKKLKMRHSNKSQPDSDHDLDDDFLYEQDDTVPFAASRSNENPDLFPMEDGDDAKTIAEVHDEFLMRSAPRADDDTNVDGFYGDELYNIDDKPSAIGYTDFATY